MCGIKFAYKMSILYFNEIGWLISHEEFVKKVYRNVHEQDKVRKYQFRNELFKIHGAYRKSRFKGKKPPESNSALLKLQENVNHVKQSYEKFKQELRTCNIFKVPKHHSLHNREALEAAQNIYTTCGGCNLKNLFGNNKEGAKIVRIQEHNYLFPNNCEFYCKDITDIHHTFKDRKFDCILLDPPWWNKYIRRKRAKSDDGYNMMYNADLMKIPIENLLKDSGLVAVWCTNSPQNIEELQSKLFPKWGLQFITEWYWLKVTTTGEPVCNFSPPPGKQPFERIIFGCRNAAAFKDFFKEKLIVSVPSALHSHKPPLNELLKPILPENPQCLEIFARYLLPNWTSIGLEAIKFQHTNCYEIIDEETNN